MLEFAIIMIQSKNYWEVCSKEGLVSIYGSKPPDDVPSNWEDPAIVADPRGRTKVASWSLTQTVDPFGNQIFYTYERDLGEEGAHQWDQIYLKKNPVC